MKIHYNYTPDINISTLGLTNGHLWGGGDGPVIIEDGTSSITLPACADWDNNQVCDVDDGECVCE